MSELTRPRYQELQDVITAAEFPELDLALRRGRHIDREDFALYTLLVEAQDHLESFYRRFGCELVHKSDGYFYLLPTGEKLSRRQLSPGDMLVGQALALLYLDPSTIERGGRITQEDVVAQLVVVLGSDALMHAFNPKQKRRLDERIAQKNVRTQIGQAIRHLAALGFVDIADDNGLRLRPSLLRFAEPVRGLSAPAEALAKLVAEGEIALVTDEAGEGETDSDDEAVEAPDDTDAPARPRAIQLADEDPESDDEADEQTVALSRSTRTSSNELDDSDEPTVALSRSTRASNDSNESTVALSRSPRTSAGELDDSATSSLPRSTRTSSNELEDSDAPTVALSRSTRASSNELDDSEQSVAMSKSTRTSSSARELDDSNEPAGAPITAGRAALDADPRADARESNAALASSDDRPAPRSSATATATAFASLLSDAAPAPTTTPRVEPADDDDEEEDDPPYVFEDNAYQDPDEDRE